MRKVNPTTAILEGCEGHLLPRIEMALTYRDKKVDFEIRRLKKNHWLVAQHGAAYVAELVEKLKAQRDVCLLKRAGDRLEIPTGLSERVAFEFSGTIVDGVERPPPRTVAWSEVPQKEMRYYQRDACDALLAAQHGAAELATGSGKTLVILHLCKSLGLKTLIMVPTTSIAEQVHGLFLKHFGKAKVGKFWGGKKEPNKLFVVASAQSLARVEEESEEAALLAESSAYIVDEAHLVAAETLAKTSLGLMRNAPYRFFMTATHMRNDGLDLLLEGITGPKVYEYPLEQAIEEGFLARPKFRVERCESAARMNPNDDPKRMERRHFYYNPEVLEKASAFANLAASAGKRVLVLVEEVKQFAMILPLLKHVVGFAHGSLGGKDMAEVPYQHRKSDPNYLVAQFDAGKLPILVGTPCIGIGTDVQSVDVLVYLQGTKSEVKVRQAIGRGTRLVPGKEHFLFVDFDVVNVPLLHNQALTRQAIYASCGGKK